MKNDGINSYCNCFTSYLTSIIILVVFLSFSKLLTSLPQISDFSPWKSKMSLASRSNPSQFLHRRQNSHYYLRRELSKIKRNLLQRISSPPLPLPITLLSEFLHLRNKSIFSEIKKEEKIKMWMTCMNDVENPNILIGFHSFFI